MGDQRQLFRFRLPWLSAAAAPRPVAAPRPAAEPQPRPAPQTQAPSQPAITIPIRRPPIRPAGFTPVQATPTPAQAPPQKTEPPQPVSSSRGAIQTQAPAQAPSRIAAPQPQSTVQTVSKQQSPPRLIPQPEGQTSSQPSSPPRRAIPVQILSPPKRSDMATSVGSQPPSSIQSLSSASREPTFKPFGVAVKPSEPSAQPKEAAPITAAAVETPAAPVKPKEMEERKKVVEERGKATEAGRKTRKPWGAAMETGKRHLEKQEDSERKKTLTTSSTDEKQIKTVSATYPKDQKHATSSLEQVPLHKEIREDISKFVHKMVTGQSKLQTDKKSASVLTLAGENRGACFHFGSESTKNDGLAHNHRGYKINPDESPDATSDGEGSSTGRKPKDSTTKENLAPTAYVNSNTQSVNNSVVFDSSLNGRNPGVHLDFFNNVAESTKSSAKAEPLEPRQMKHSSLAGKSKVLIIGGTGYIGKFIVEASAKEGHPTFALVRKSSVSDPVKGKIIENLKNLGVQFLYGDLYDHESLVKAIKQVDVVISAVGQTQLADQLKIIAAIKEAGNVKRFFPSEFGNDVDRVHAVEPAKSAFATKARIRRAIEAEGIPYTYVSSNCFAGYFLPTLSQLGATAPPRDKVVILGDGNAKAVFNYEGDIGTYTIKAVDDPRTLNKILYIRPPKNIYSFNEIVALWEKLIGKTLEKTYVPEDQLLKQIQEAPIPMNFTLAISHSTFVKGDHTNFEIEPSFGVEASELYPDVKYTTVEECLSRFV